MNPSARPSGTLARRFVVAPALILLSFVVGVEAQDDPWPKRPAKASGGREFVLGLAKRNAAEREKAIEAELLAGNVPARLRRFVAVTLRGEVSGRRREVVLDVLPDVLGIGGDEDWIRMPMRPATAQRIADRVGCRLPTRKIVNAIHGAAVRTPEPIPFSPKEHDILAPELFVRHHDAIEAALKRVPERAGIVSGIKKDVVISPLLARFPDRVVIYGWHRKDGQPIQPLSKIHTTPHVDYSHGIRFVRKACRLDGKPADLDALLADPVLHVLLSDEGPLESARYPER